MTPLIQFDIRTLLVSEAAVCLLFSLVMLLMAKHYPYVGGLRQLSLKFVATTGGISFFLMRSLFPYKLDVLLSNGLYCISNLFAYIGISALLQVRPRLRLPILLAVLSTVALTYYRGAGQTDIRIAIISLVDLLLRAFLMVALLRNLRRGAAVKMLAVFTGLFLLCDAVRMIATFHYGAPTDVFQYNVTQADYIAISLLANCGIGIFSLALAAREVTGAIERRARRDSLTGALNRLGMEEQLAVEMERLRRTQTACCVALMDVDNFKSFNDSGGHALGDKVLQRIAACVHANLRSYDVFGRIGGDEFMLLLPGLAAPDAVAVCRRMVKAIAALPHDSAAGASPTVSLGLTEIELSDSSEAILVRADKALYAAKRLGKNGVEMELAATGTGEAAPPAAPEPMEGSTLSRMAAFLKGFRA